VVSFNTESKKHVLHMHIQLVRVRDRSDPAEGILSYIDFFGQNYFAVLRNSASLASGCRLRTAVCVVWRKRGYDVSLKTP
jgi:hypothetical protein